MRAPRLDVLIACAAAALLGGCGSSSRSSSSTTSTATNSTTSSSSSFKATTTPKFAQPSSSAPVQSGTVQIAYRNIAISPDTVRVKVGSTIKWTNFDAVQHNVISQSDRSKIGQQKFESKEFGEGGTYEIKALKPGLIHYECTIHPASMNGTIEVVK